MHKVIYYNVLTGQILSNFEVGLASSTCTLYSDIQRCMLRAANITGSDNHFLFVGDSRVREQFHEFVDSVIGVRGTYNRSDTFQAVTVQRLRLRAVRFSIIAAMNP